MIDSASKHQYGPVGKRAVLCALIILLGGLFMMALPFLLADGPARPDDLLIQGANLQEREWIQRGLRRGADVNAKDFLGATALMWACRDGDMELVRSLLERGAHTTAGAEMGITPLMLAVDNGHPEVAELLLRSGAPVDQRLPIGTALHVAAARGRAAMARLLIDHGADLEARDNQGQTPLMRCVGNDNAVATATVLIAAGARLDATNDRGERALEMAQTERQADLAALLVQAAAKHRAARR